MNKNVPQRYYSEDNFEAIYFRILNNLRDCPEFRGKARGTPFHEIANLSFELTNPYDNRVWNGGRKANYEFAMRFALWILNGCDDYDYVKGVNPNAASYLKDCDPGKLSDAKFSTAYGPRIARQIDMVIDELVRDPGSRRAVVSILEEKDLEMLPTGTKEEFPCIESLTFFIRQDNGHFQPMLPPSRLHCHCQMRSNNMATTVIYDVFAFTMIQEYVLKRLQQIMPFLKMGSYYHHCTSAHYFADQDDLVNGILNAPELKVLPGLKRADEIHKPVVTVAGLDGSNKEAV